MDEPQIATLENGHQLRYRRFGIGKSIIFLHGYPETHSIWLTLMKELSAKYDVLAFDWPGMGGSDVWKGGSTPKSMGARIIQIMNYFKIDNAHLVGHDMGGQPALVCASDHPNRIKSVTVINSLLIHNAQTSWEIRYLRNLTLNKLILTFLPRVVFNRAIQTFGKNEIEISSELKDEFWHYFSKETVRRYIIRMCYGYQAQLPKLAKFYSKVTCPVLALWSKDNKHFSVDHGVKLKEILPKTKIVTLDGSSHWIGYYRTKETKNALIEFLDNL